MYKTNLQKMNDYYISVNNNIERVKILDYDRKIISGGWTLVRKWWGSYWIWRKPVYGKYKSIRIMRLDLHGSPLSLGIKGIQLIYTLSKSDLDENIINEWLHINTNKSIYFENTLIIHGWNSIIF